MPRNEPSGIHGRTDECGIEVNNTRERKQIRKGRKNLIGGANCSIVKFNSLAMRSRHIHMYICALAVCKNGLQLSQYTYVGK
jgi:hypothetical protein